MPCGASGAPSIPSSSRQAAELRTTNRISIATILHAFEVRKLPGHVYCADDSAFEGIVSFPAHFSKDGQLRPSRLQKLKPFPVDFVPRSERHADAVREGLLAV